MSRVCGICIVPVYIGCTGSDYRLQIYDTLYICNVNNNQNVIYVVLLYFKFQSECYLCCVILLQISGSGLHVPLHVKKCNSFVFDKRGKKRLIAGKFSLLYIPSIALYLNCIYSQANKISCSADNRTVFSSFLVAA
jgi:hypothetical protein